VSKFHKTLQYFLF